MSHSHYFFVVVVVVGVHHMLGKEKANSLDFHRFYFITTSLVFILCNVTLPLNIIILFQK